MQGPIRWPERVRLARLPTPIEPLESYSKETGAEIFVKRDDLTGLALSGNKVRKLEFLLHEAIKGGADKIYTCGGIQSNHARATAAACARLGFECRLFLRVTGAPPERVEGNVLMDLLAGAEIEHITPAEYREAEALMIDRAAADDARVYVIPEGGSNAVGALGYARAVREIIEAEQRTGPFDAVVHAVGSGGTCAGLILGRKAFGLGAEVVGVNVCDDEAYFVERVGRILEGAAERFAPGLSFGPEDIRILDGHVGPGYARATPAHLETIRSAARRGLFLDPAYTAKAFQGMLEEIRHGRLSDRRRILFIHTGGIFSLFARADELP